MTTHTLKFLLATALLATACPAVALAQAPAQPYTPAVPPPSMVGGYGAYGYGGYDHASTAAQGAMDGMASVISARGDYNLATSAAAVNATQAQSMAIKNRQQYTDAYFSMKETNRVERAKLAGPRPTAQQIAHYAEEGVPRPMGPTEMDPLTGKLIWPAFLQTAEFNTQRAMLDPLLQKRAQQGSLSYAEQTTVRQTVDAMFAQMKKEIRDVPPPDYIASRSFLNSLLYAATKNELQ
ncbi:MAG: hypothetical protein RIC55_31265 [Pirellulaceae bacterium]